MAKTPEAKVKDAVKALLKEYECYYFMPVQAGYGMPSLDFLVCCNGMFLAIETKAPGKKPTPRQEDTIAQMKLAGAVTFVVDGDMALVEDTLKLLTGREWRR